MNEGDGIFVIRTLGGMTAQTSDDLDALVQLLKDKGHTIKDAMALHGGYYPPTKDE